ncbi:MAG: DUF4143 domain-containing protein [Candidatus Methanomethyliaceae archaeon]
MSNVKINHKQDWIERTLNIASLIEKKSCFLFGPRQTGKTSLFKDMPVLIYDLLDSETHVRLSYNPGIIAQEITPETEIVIIDDVQRLPFFLNEVHRLIEERRIGFLLTSSSARKLRRGGVNLLGGRARIKYLHPLISGELRERFDLKRAIERGSLPSIYFSDDPKADIEAYIGTYLQQEIIAGGPSRNIPAFSRFLKITSSCNGTVVNFINLANDAQVKRRTVYEYFEILKDTLVLYELAGWRKTKKRKPIASSKYYFFDVGVVSGLQGRAFKMETPEFGEAFETYIMHELVSHSDYVSGLPLSFWTSTSEFEVDFIIGDHTAIEVKAKGDISPQDVKSLRALEEESEMKHYICVCLEPHIKKMGNIST